MERLLESDETSAFVTQIIDWKDLDPYIIKSSLRLPEKCSWYGFKYKRLTWSSYEKQQCITIVWKKKFWVNLFKKEPISSNVACRQFISLSRSI